MAAGATYEPIATTTLGSAASSITFSSIPSTYTDLRVVLTGTGDGSYQAAMRFNTDTGTNYSTTELFGDGSTVFALSETNSTYINAGRGGAFNTTPQMASYDIFSYAGSTYKTTLMTYSADQNGSGVAIGRSVGLWRSTSAINQVVIVSANGANNLSTGTTATLYGIKAA